MGFADQSATGVPAPQPQISSAIAQSLWPHRRTRRGFSTTVLGLLLLLGVSRTGHTEPARMPARMPALTPPAAETANRESWSRRLAQSHFERALVLEKRADIAQALSEYSQAIAIDSTFGEAYSHLGALRERMGDVREAELVYSEGVRLGDTRARALLDRAHLWRARGRGAEAMADLEASVELEPSRAALTELAQHYVEVQAWSAALATFRRIAGLAAASGDSSALEPARLEVRALRVLAAETDPSSHQAKRHDWVGRALISLARR